MSNLLFFCFRERRKKSLVYFIERNKKSHNLKTGNKNKLFIIMALKMKNVKIVIYFRERKKLIS